MPLTGDLFIAGQRASTNDTFQAQDPATGEMLETAFSIAGADEINSACIKASSCFDDYRSLSTTRRADFLEAIAENIEAAASELTPRAMQETGLPEMRLNGERGRTTGQLRQFSQVLRRGDFLGLRHDEAIPDRQPLPRPDLRQRKIPLGPVAVFGASNFPLAFSVAGGDTASALAAGCPVIVKGHPAHPGTSEIVAHAIQQAAKDTGMPSGVFSLLNGGIELGTALVSHPDIKAIGFTGSRRGGLAIQKAVMERSEPIPVYAEMSSINPVILMPSALHQNTENLATGFAGSMSMGAGQFCTNPGLIFAIAGEDLDQFLKLSASNVTDLPPQTMLTTNIHQAYCQGIDRLISIDGVEVIARGNDADTQNQGQATLLAVSAADFRKHEELQEECFGASSLIVRCESMTDLSGLINDLEGQLTCTLMMTDEDNDSAVQLVPALERKAGRVIVNAWPTGVEVSDAMIHGGPFPATTDSRSTSVGTLSIDRFLRPVSYQGFPEALLPTEFRHGDHPKAPTLQNGRWV